VSDQAVPDVPAVPGAVVSVLEEARTRHLLGPAPLDEQVAHALGFVVAAVSAGAGAVPRRWLDLGSGGGLPGLVLAGAWPDSSGLLLDAAQRRARFLVESVDALGWADRVAVVHGRAEDVARDPAYRAGFGLVVARSFGPPAVTAECGAPFLQVGGVLVVSEPPDEGPDRWPSEPLQTLGLAPERRVRDRFGYEVLRQIAPCPDRFPRRAGVAARRPLYRTSGEEPGVHREGERPDGEP